MMSPFTIDNKVGEVVTVFPKASDIFKSNRIDICCGGNLTIKEAAAKQMISAEQLITQLNMLYKQSNPNKDYINWKEKSFSHIVHYIEETHHQYLKEELPQLTPYITKVYKVHGNKHHHLEKVKTLFQQLKTELLEHLMLEEDTQFPLIKEYDRHPTHETLERAVSQLDRLEKDHQNVGNILKELRKVTNNYHLPVGACRTFQLVYKRLEHLEEDTLSHIHIENNILFKRLINLHA
ncbi:iron-sulfur cluster repair di-iron protein [Heyndrickxia oleronia]|nr:iron-sulfur cluster repair di-iron protein [Heyndrickxia oleronia]